MNAPSPRDALARPLRDLRLSVIEACNFRCPYCMPAERIADDHGLDAAGRLSFDEIETLVRGFAAIGVHKLRLTGGEPLLRKRLPELVARLATVPGINDLALTTNGSLLAAQAHALRQAGLHRLTVSLDALDPEAFAAMSGGRGSIIGTVLGVLIIGIMNNLLILLGVDSFLTDAFKGAIVVAAVLMQRKEANA